MARPKFKIDYDKAEAMAGILCTQLEIAHVLGCSVDTLQRDPKFKDSYAKGQSVGKSSLRRYQWDKARTGNATMLIWLGKNMLGQTDRVDLQPDGADESEKLSISYKVVPAKAEVKITTGKNK